MARKTSKADFAAFRAEFERVAAMLGCQGWQVYFDHTELSDGLEAQVETDSVGRTAVVQMQSRWDGTETAGFDPAEAGRHEAIHLFLVQLEYLAQCRYVQPDTIENTVEGMVRTLEKVIA